MNHSHIFIITFYLLCISTPLSVITMDHRKIQKRELLKRKLERNKCLLNACDLNDIRKVLHLIIKGANVNYENKLDNKHIVTPLSIACNNRNFILAKILIDCNAHMLTTCSIIDPDKKHTKSGFNPWLIACTKQCNDICAYMIEKDPSILSSQLLFNRYSCLHISASTQNYALTQMILTADVGKKLVNQLAEEDTSPLYTACFIKNARITRLLLENGANPNQYTGSQQTPIRLALEKGAYEIVKLFIKHKVDLNAKIGLFGSNIMHFAADIGDTTIGNLLIEHHANINATNSYNITPIFLAVVKNNISFVKMLLKAGVNAQENMYLVYLAPTPLSQEKVKALLIKYGADFPCDEENEQEKNNFFSEIKQSQPEEIIQSCIAQDCPNESTTDHKPLINHGVLQQEPPIPGIAQPNDTSAENPSPENKNYITKKIISKPRKNFALTETSHDEKNICMILQSENLTWPAGLPEIQRKNLHNHIRELAYFYTRHIPNIKKLHGQKNTYRLRAGILRVLFLLDKQKNQIKVFKIDFRKGVYKKL